MNSIPLRILPKQKIENASADELLNYALAIWFRDLKRYKNTIGVFKALESSVKPERIQKHHYFEHCHIHMIL